MEWWNDGLKRNSRFGLIRLRRTLRADFANAIPAHHVLHKA